jgi:hypothetical protein
VDDRHAAQLPGVATTSPGTGAAAIIFSNNGRCSFGSPAGSNGDARNMLAIASRCCWVMSVPLQVGRGIRR